LHAASLQGHAKVVEKLLAHGANANLATSNLGRAPLYDASYGGHVHVVAMLLGKGADVNRPTTGDGTTALQIAAKRGQAAVVRVLLAAGARIWDESQGFPDVAGGLSWANVSEIKRSIGTSS
jgi:ankyrin repeat protein